MRYKRFEDVPVWQAAVKLAVAVFDLTRPLAFRRAGDLADQMQRAALSISNNMAEGFERGTTQELIAFLYYARGSAGEVRSILCVARRMSSLADYRSQIEDLTKAAESISHQLAGGLNSLKETPIRGDRHLTQATRAAAEKSREREEFLRQLRENVESVRRKREAAQSKVPKPETCDE